MEQYARPEGEWYLYPDQPIVDRAKRKERPWRSYVVLPVVRKTVSCYAAGSTG